MPELLAQPTLEPNAQLLPNAIQPSIGGSLAQFEQHVAELAGPYAPRHAAEKLSLRDRIIQTRLGRRIGVTVAALTVAVTGVALETSPAAADSNQEYTIADTAAGGVYSRNSPRWEDTPRIDGKGIYPGDVVRLICGVTNGEAYGPYNNTTWHKIINLTRSEHGEFWENDHHFNTPNKAGELAPGEKNCNEQAPEQSKPDFKGCYYNMKAPNTTLTFSYEGDHRYYGNAWQAAKNWTDLGTGITIKPGSGDTYIKFKDVYEKGSNWYARAVIPATVDWLGRKQGDSWSYYNDPPQNPHTPSSVTIEVNQYYMDEYEYKGEKGLDDKRRTYTLGHEIGHALGLAHPDKCGIDDKSIVRSGGNVPEIPYNKPQAYDKMALEDLYGLSRQ